MNQFEEAGNDRLFVAHVERAQHQPFGELVEGENNQREGGNPPIGFLKDGVNGSHE